MASNLGSMILELSANTARFQSDMGKAAYIAQQNAEKMQKTIQGAVDGISGSLQHIAGSIIAAFSVDRLVEFAKQAIDTADEVGKMAQKVGVSVESLSALNLQAKLSGSGIEGLQTGMERLARTAAEAAGGSKQQAAAFSAIGVAVKDAAGNLRPMDDILAEVAKKFASYGDSAAKTALAQKLFGKAGAELIPTLNEIGDKGLPGVIKQAKEFGATISGDTAKRAEEFNDNLTKMGAEARGFANAVIEKLLPSLVKLTDQMVDAGKTTDNYKSSSTELANVIKGMIFGLVSGYEGFKLWNRALQDFFDIGRAVFSAVGQVVQIWSETTTKAVKSAFTLDKAGLDSADKEFQDRIAGVGAGVATAVKKANDDITKGSTDAFDSVRKSYDSLLGTFANVQSGVTTTGHALRNLKAPLVDHTNAAEDAAKASQQLADMFAKDGEQLASLRAKIDPVNAIYQQYVKTIASAVDAYNKEVALAATSKHRDDDLATALANLNAKREAGLQAQQESIDKLVKENDIVGQLFQKMADQESLIGLTDREREQTEAVNSAVEAWNKMPPALQAYLVEQGKIDPTTEAGTRAIQNQVGALHDHKLAADLSAEAARGWQSIWAQAGNAVAETFAKVLIEGGNLFKGLRDLAKQTVEQIIAYFAKLAVINPILNAIFGGVSGFSLLPSLANAGGTDGGSTTSLLGGISGKLGSIVSIAGGIFAGVNAFKSAGGGVGGLAAGGAYGYGTYAIGTGVTAGIAAGSITAGLAAIPIAGWIAIGAMIIDKFSGGKLFGTSANKFVSGTQTQTIGDTGADVDTSAVFKGQKSFFRGSYYKTKNLATDPEVQKAADEFYAQLKESTEAFAKQFAITGAKIVGGTFTTTFDKAGKATGTSSTVLGVTRTGETQQQFAERLQADSYLAVLDKMGLAASEFVAGMQEDADKLLAAVQDFATVAQAANTDLANGFKFMALQSKATLMDVMKFVEGLQAGGESLSQTYQRLAQAQMQYNQFVAQFTPGTQYVDDFEAAFSQLYHQMVANIDTANKLAIAAGASGAAQEDLAHIQAATAHQMAALVQQLQASAQSLAFSLGLTTKGSLDQVNAEIDRLQGISSSTADSLDQATKSTKSFGNAVGAVAKQTNDAINLLLGNLSPLNDQQKLQIALQGLRAGTVTQEQVLSIGRNLYASSEAYNDLFSQVQQYGGKAGKGGGFKGITSVITTGANASTVAEAQKPALSEADQKRLDDLIKQRDLLQASQTMQQYQTLATQIAEIATAKGEDFRQVLDEMGIQQKDLEAGLKLSSDEALRAYIDNLQSQQDSAKENTQSIVDAVDRVYFVLATGRTATPSAQPSITPIRDSDGSIISVGGRRPGGLPGTDMTAREIVDAVVAGVSRSVAPIVADQPRSNRVALAR